MLRSNAAGLLAIIFLGLAACDAVAADSSPKSLEGIVVDPAGRPAAGAKVWLTRADFPHEAQVLQTAVADAAGRFTLRDPPRESGANRWLTLAARDAKGRLGGAGLPPPGDPAGQAIRIELVEVRDHRGQLVDGAGRPIAKVPLRLMRLGAVAPSRPAQRHPVGVAPELAAQIGARTADDGSFTLRGVPIEGDIMVEVVAPGFGSPWVWWELGKPVTIRLDLAGSVAGSLGGPKEASVAGVKVLLFTSQDEAYTGYSVTVQQDARTGKDGSFLFAAVPPGTYRLRADLDEKSPYASGNSPDFKVKPGDHAKVALEFIRLIAVRGKVIDRQSKTGVPGVGLQFYTMKESRDIAMTRETKTDAQGEYSLQILPGKVSGYVNACPDKYTVPDPGPGLRRDPLAKDATWPVIELDLATNVEGVVVDESGGSVAEAEIHFLRTSPSFRIETGKCDRAGKFVIKQLPGTGTISIQARTDSAATIDPLTVAVDKANRPIRLVVSQAKAGGVHGVLVDDAGRPVRQAYVWFRGNWTVGASRHGFQVATGRSNDQGRFEIRGLWPGEYQLQFMAPDVESPPQRNVALRQGQSLDLGKIVLDSAQGAIEGTVVDSAGKPLSGVRVFNSGNAPRRISTRSDAAGRFRMQGFRKGAAYVFAEQPGYRFRAVLATSGAAGVTIRLPRNDEPPPVRPAAKQLSDEKRRELARGMLEKLWAAGDRAQMDGALVAMAMLDPAKAQQWAARRGPEVQEALKSMAAMRMAETDLDEAIALLPADGSRAVMFLRRVAERFAADEPAKALRCAEEGIVRARGLNEPERAEALAGFGGLLTRLGRQETGRKLVEEAAQIAARLPATPAATLARGKVAGAVAAFDLKRALALLEPIPDRNQRTAWLPNVTAAASVSQPEQARALWKGLEPFYLSRAKAATACRLAQTNPEEALRIVESIEGDYAHVQKIEALGRIAVTAARSDKPRAFAIIDRALALALEPPPRGNYFTHHRDLPGKTAMLAVYAQRIGYPDLQSVSDRVLASRLPLRDVMPDQAIEDSLAIAAILALADPETAGPLLRLLEPQVAHLNTSENRVAKSQWFQAWALADPQHAVELADRDWAAGSKTPGWDIARSGILEVPLILSLPKSDRLEYVGQRVGISPSDQ